MAARPARSARPCLECGRVTTNGSRCATHEAAREQRRGSSTARGYGSQWQRVSRAVLDRDGRVCHYCGRPATTADHVIPKARGGTDDPDNLVAACVSCNSAKGVR